MLEKRVRKGKEVVSEKKGRGCQKKGIDLVSEKVKGVVCQKKGGGVVSEKEEGGERVRKRECHKGKEGGGREGEEEGVIKRAGVRVRIGKGGSCQKKERKGLSKKERGVRKKRQGVCWRKERRCVGGRGCVSGEGKDGV